VKVNPTPNSKIKTMKVGDKFSIKLSPMNATTQKVEETIEILEIGTYPSKPGSKISYKGAKVKILRTGEIRILSWMILEFVKEVSKEKTEKVA